MAKSSNIHPDQPASDGARSTASAGDENAARRNFLWGFAASVVGFVVSIIPLGISLGTFLDPLRSKQKLPKKYDPGTSGGDGFLKITTLDAVKDDGIPRRFPVIANLSDAWNFIPGQPIGAIYLSRDKGSQTVRVFHSTCPHAGCSVDYTHDSVPENCLFKCPCHNSAFTVEGKRVDLPGKKNPSPRDLDTLKIDEEKLATNGEIWVKFLNYYTGEHEMRAKI